MPKGKYIYIYYWYEYKWPPVRYNYVEALATQVLRHYYYYYWSEDKSYCGFERAYLSLPVGRYVPAEVIRVHDKGYALAWWSTQHAFDLKQEAYFR